MARAAIGIITVVRKSKKSRNCMPKMRTPSHTPYQGRGRTSTSITTAMRTQHFGRLHPVHPQRQTLVSSSEIALVSAARNIRKKATPTSVPTPMLAKILGV
ncbi:MAG: hypothetical protein ACLVJ6_14920 [Merdibacter sp.]